MDTMGGLNRMIAYIEAHLDEALDNAALARVAGCYQWHLQRMFPFIAGIPLSEYIRRRRLTAAAFALQRGEDKVIDLAAKYGYASPTAFNRAFQAVHGISPSAARRQGSAPKA